METLGIKNRMKVLLVEDDAAITRTLSISLRDSGFDVSTAELGGKALQMISSERFDAVVLDLGLPDGRGGDVLRLLQQGSSQGGPVWLTISALDKEDAERRHGALGAPFLAKPFDPWELVRTLENLLQRDDSVPKARI